MQIPSIQIHNTEWPPDHLLLTWWYINEKFAATCLAAQTPVALVRPEAGPTLETKPWEFVRRTRGSVGGDYALPSARSSRIVLLPSWEYSVLLEPGDRVETGRTVLEVRQGG